MSPEENQPVSEDSAEFAEAIQEVERSLDRLKERYREIIDARRQKTELEEELDRKEREYRENPLPSLETELTGIQERIQEIGVILESDLLENEGSRRLYAEILRRDLLGEIFWQILRFGGIGVVLGWVLKSCAG
ncbi:hypothetical protein V0288_23635 [Pannus brasiliensis CCIBt3594]|uniref:DUF2203 domain-containing protein n=1 Tax=Pannus brasiliensis CCIBt3594 TaxID=1427578 RepID=A0AAW9QZA0_9CHRO